MIFHHQNGRELILRSAALALALTAAMTTYAATTGENWVATRTQPTLVQQANATKAKGSSATSWSLAAQGSPSVAASQLSPIESDKPLQVTLSLNLRNVDELESLLKQINDPTSSHYQKFLTPEQFKARFAPTDSQVQAVVEHLRKYGFNDIRPADNHLLVTASGTTGTAATAFHTHFQRVSFQNESHFANDEAASVPESLSGIVDAVLGLQDVVKAHTLHTPPVPVSNTGGAKSLAAAAVTAHEPTEFPAIYNAASTPAGTATTVGIIGWGSQSQPIADLQTFTQKHGLATVSTKEVHTGSGSYTDQPASNVEWNLDSQAIVGTAGGVKQLIFYTSPDASLAGVTASYNQAVSDNAAKIINVSLGVDESASASNGSQAADDKIFAQAAAQGQIFSVSAGDAGVYQWSTSPLSHTPGYVLDSSGNVAIDLSHYSVSEPSTSPNVVAVGGTTLSTNGSSWSGETVWNEGLQAITFLGFIPDGQRLWATGGGISQNETAPSWQSSALGSSISHRQVPDVAYDAARSSGAKIIIGGSTQQQYGTDTVQVGGTSLASPIFVGVWARIESAHGNSLGLPTSNFYKHFSSDGAPLHDVVAGNNGYNGYGYAAKTGYDNSTGWGSLDISKLNTYVGKYW